MMRPLSILAACLTLAACGADGEPERPEAKPAVQSGPGVSVTITGSAEVGISG